MEEYDLLLDVKKILKRGFYPSEESIRFMKSMGPEKTVNGLKNRLIEFRYNDDKTFDVVSTKLLINQLLSNVKKELDEEGYVLTTKGEDMILNNYSGTEFMKSVTKGIIGMSKVEGFKK